METTSGRDRDYDDTHRAAVMLVDDDDHLREAVCLLLEDHGYGVSACGGAAEALDQLRAGAAPDLILLDLLMPQMNGWEFRVEQKRQPKLASIPVVALSADLSAKAAAIDARAYLAKPFDDQLLLDTVDQVIKELECERLRARASELDRLSSLGALAGGIAHEINNPLAFVLGNLELALRQAGELEARLSGRDAFSMVGLSQVLSRAQRGAERIATVVRGVSMFAGASTDADLAIDVHEVLESSLQVASNEIRHCARLERAYGSVATVRGNAAQLGQVFLNLLLNAVRAIGDAAPGDHIIRVATSMDAHDNVVVAISDTGRGIAPGFKSRVFDPFFAVTGRNVGTGLGLAVSREIIESMGGTIDFESDVQAGSLFRVILPSYVSALMPRPDLVSVPKLKSKPQRTRVLVVDDEPLMCEMIATVLGSDYDVATFTEPRAALASMIGGSFDVILCDLMMPDLTGMDLYERLVRERPDLAERVIFISGGAFTDRARQFLATTRRPQIKKPFRHEELIDAIEGQLRVKH